MSSGKREIVQYEHNRSIGTVPGTWYGTYLSSKPKRTQHGTNRINIKKRIFKNNVGYLAKAHRELKQILRAGSVERNITSRASRTACSVRIWAHVNRSKKKQEIAKKFEVSDAKSHSDPNIKPYRNFKRKNV
jgi:hypothetical protein